MFGCKKVNFYTEMFSTIDKGRITTLSDIQRNLSPEIELNYRRLLPENKDAKILDIGCGWGYFLYYLKINGYLNVEGIDLKTHIKRLEFIRKNITENVTGIDTVEKYFSHHINEYDWIILKQVIYYFKREDLLNIMKSIMDSLKMGGILVVETFNGSLLTSTFVQNQDYERVLILTEYSLAQVLLDAGFELKELFGTKLPKRKGLKGMFWICAQKIWLLLLRLMYILERGKDSRLIPHIFSKHIIAVAQKGKIYI